MTFKVGDRVVAESESTDRVARCGTVREVLREAPGARYRIDWDDGSTHRRPGRCKRLAETRSRHADAALKSAGTSRAGGGVPESMC